MFQVYFFYKILLLWDFKYVYKKVILQKQLILNSFLLTVRFWRKNRRISLSNWAISKSLMAAYVAVSWIESDVYN